MKLKSKKLIRKWLSNGTPTRTLIIEMRLLRSLGRYQKLIKTFLIPKNAKLTTHTDFKDPRHHLFIILSPEMQKIYSRNSITTISLMMTPFLVVSSTENNLVEDFSVALDHLDLGKVCLTMMIFSQDWEI